MAFLLLHRNYSEVDLTWDYESSLSGGDDVDNIL